jgi:hypothetical protein
MSLPELILERVRDLPSEKQREVLGFIESLRRSGEPAKPLHGLEGIWEDMGFDITEEDIAQARREMWSNFPREIV